jgi:hypothetical protein
MMLASAMRTAGRFQRQIDNDVAPTGVRQIFAEEIRGLDLRGSYDTVSAFSFSGCGPAALNPL